MIVQVQGAGPGPQRPGRAGDLLDRLPLDAQGRDEGTDLGRRGLSADDFVHGPFHFLFAQVLPPDYFADRISNFHFFFLLWRQKKGRESSRPFF